MGKKRNKIVSTLKTLVQEIDERPPWLQKLERAKTFEEIHESVKDFKLILESNIGNRDEDIEDVPDNVTGSAPDSDNDTAPSEQTL
jgi:hypothetical protein